MRVLSALFAVLALCAAPASALDNIRNEVFGVSSGVAHEPSLSGGAVTFEADATSVDAVQGWTFYITERDAGQGDGDQLLRIVSQSCEPVPPPGTPVKVEVIFYLTCTADGRLRGAPGGWVRVAWCDAAGSHFCWDFHPSETVLDTSDPEDFEIVLQGDDLVDGQRNPVPENALHCQGTSTPVSESFATEGFVSSGVIGLYFDLEGNTCTGRVVPFVVSSMYLLAKLSGLTSCGISGAEFRIEGLPSEWLIRPTSLGPTLQEGDPLGSGGAVGYPGCAGAATGIAPIYRYDILAFSPLNDVVLRVLSRQPSSDPMHPFLRAFMCDAAHSSVRMDGGTAYINPTGPVPCDAPVSVRSLQWGAVKDLYR